MKLKTRFILMGIVFILGGTIVLFLDPQVAMAKLGGMCLVGFGVGMLSAVATYN